MPSSMDAQHPRRQGPPRASASSSAGNRSEQPQLGARRCDRDRVEQGARACGQPRRAGQDGVAHALGQRGPAGGQRLGHVERVAARDTVELDGVDLVRLGQILHRPLRQRLEPQARDGRPRQLAQNSAERVGPAHLVVAVGEDDERRSGLDSAREQADEVERGAVGTVQILEHDHVRRPPAKLVEERGEHVDRPGSPLDEPLELAAGLACDVGERAERPRRLERLARAGEDARRGDVQAERLDEGGLADARLTADQHELAATRAVDGGERAAERVELGRALEQLLGALKGAGGRDQRGSIGLGSLLYGGATRSDSKSSALTSARR